MQIQPILSPVTTPDLARIPVGLPTEAPAPAPKDGFERTAAPAEATPPDKRSRAAKSEKSAAKSLKTPTLPQSVPVTLAAETPTTKLEAPAPPSTVGFDRANMDISVDPSQDFYRYAMGNYLKNHPIPDSESRWGIDSELVLNVRHDLKGILETCASAPGNAEEKKIGDFYVSGLDQGRRDQLGLKPLQGALDKLDSIQSLGDVARATADMHRDGVDAFFGFGSGQDARDQTRVIAQIGQGGLGLPNGEYYTNTDPDSVTLQQQYRQHMERTFELAGLDPQAAAKAADTAYRVEDALARVSLTTTELRDPAALYNPTSVQSFETSHPNTHFGDYLGAVGMQNLDSVNDSTVKFFDGMDKVLGDTPVGDLKTYLKWRLLSTASPALSTDFVNEDFSFSSRLTGSKAQQEPWQKMVGQTDDLFGDALGKKFVEKRFTPEAKAKAVDLVKNIISSLQDHIQQSAWMSEPTKEQALDKVAKMHYKIGYPDTWKDYSNVAIDRNDYLGNVFNAKGAMFQEDLDRIGKPVDKNRWLMTPSTVNAYYDPPNNEFVFPAAILQPPYFDAKADDALNYGATGCTIGHEITHGFDDEGRQYDSDGNLRDWWQPSDADQFAKRAEGVEKQFDAFQVDGLHLNGKQVLGESLADLGGLELAWGAFEKAREQDRAAGKIDPPSPDGFTPEQRFFLSYAESWAQNYRPEAERTQILNNPHPLPEFRVNGPLANFPPFAQAFGIKSDTPMARTGDARCHLWDG